MKITTEQLRAIAETENRRARSTQSPAQGFDALLAKELIAGQGNAAADIQNAGLTGAVSAPLQNAAADAGSGESDATAERFAVGLENVCGTLDQYAGQLALNEGADLRQAYALLERMSGQMASMREALPAVAERQPELAAMFNELDVLAVTETFKFNRGDYLA